MSKEFDSIEKGLIEAIEHASKKRSGAVVHDFKPIDVKNVRTHLNMSQPEFAASFGISVSTLRHWERGDRTPRGPALVLLNVISKESKAVLRALSNQSGGGRS